MKLTGQTFYAVDSDEFVGQILNNFLKYFLWDHIVKKNIKSKCQLRKGSNIYFAQEIFFLQQNTVESHQDFDLTSGDRKHIQIPIVLTAFPRKSEL